MRVPEDSVSGNANVVVDFNEWTEAKIVPSSVDISVMPAIPLARRFPVSPRVERRLIHPDRKSLVLKLEFSPDGQHILGSSYPDNSIQKWDAVSGKQLLTIATPREYKSAYRFWHTSADFSRLYCWIESRGNREKTKINGEDAIRMSYPDSGIQVWDTRQGNLLDRNLDNSSHKVRYVQMSPDKNWLLSYEVASGTFVGQPPSVVRLHEIATGQWSKLPDSVNAQTVFSNNSGFIASFEGEGDDTYTRSVVIRKIPGLETVRSFELPPGIHNGNALVFLADDRYLVVEYRTYERKNSWNRWKTTIVCYDMEDGVRTGEYQFPLDNDSPWFASQLMGEDTLVFGNWRGEPKRLTGLSIPELDTRWETVLGDYLALREVVVSPQGDLGGIVCVPKAEKGLEADPRNVDWDIVPQNHLKLFDGNGKIVETLMLPVGASSMVFAKEGDRAAIGALGSAYLLNLSPPFGD